MARLAWRANIGRHGGLSDVRRIKPYQSGKLKTVAMDTKVHSTTVQVLKHTTHLLQPRAA